MSAAETGRDYKAALQKAQSEILTLKQACDLAYGEGYSKGYAEGFEDGQKESVPEGQS